MKAQLQNESRAIAAKNSPWNERKAFGEDVIRLGKDHNTFCQRNFPAACNKLEAMKATFGHFHVRRWISHSDSKLGPLAFIVPKEIKELGDWWFTICY